MQAVHLVGYDAEGAQVRSHERRSTLPAALRACALDAPPTIMAQ